MKGRRTPLPETLQFLISIQQGPMILRLRTKISKGDVLVPRTCPKVLPWTVAGNGGSEVGQSVCQNSIAKKVRSRWIEDDVRSNP